MDEIHANETSAKNTLPNSRLEITNKFKILSSLSDLIKFVVSDTVFTYKDVMEQLLNIVKMIKVENDVADRNNNMEADNSAVMRSSPSRPRLPTRALPDR